MNREKQIKKMQNALIEIAEQPIMIEGLADWSDVIAEALWQATARYTMITPFNACVMRSVAKRQRR